MGWLEVVLTIYVTLGERALAVNWVVPRQANNTHAFRRSRLPHVVFFFIVSLDSVEIGKAVVSA